MKISRDEARRIAALAHLEFDDASLDRLAGEMTRILEYIDQLREVSDGNADDGARVTTSAPQHLRDDLARPGVDQDAIARNAPEFENGFFVVPKVIE